MKLFRNSQSMLRALRKYRFSRPLRSTKPARDELVLDLMREYVKTLPKPRLP